MGNRSVSATGITRASLVFVISAVIAACSGGGGGGGGGGAQTQSVGGGGVKGPLANAIVTAYAYDSAGLKGAIIGTGSTDANAKITGLALPLPLTPPYILEFTSDAGTTDITTGVAPVITTMRTVLTQDLLNTGEDVYATPLTTMATDLAFANADSNVAPYVGDNDSTPTATEFVAALPIAASQVTSTLGFGLDSSVDIFDTPPLVDATTTSGDEQQSVAEYRAAVEALTAVVYQMDQQGTGDTGAVMDELVADLADGLIDGQVDGAPSTVFAESALQVLEQDPATLPIPGTAWTVADIEAVLQDDVTNTGSGLTVDTASIEVQTEPAETNPDIDGDGTLNADDAFPNDPAEDTDTDGDGVGDNTDTDIDSDGWLNGEDDYPLDATQFLDPSLDRDGDTVANGTDPCPLDATDACVGLTDTDGDGVEDTADNCQANSNPSQTDTNTDGEGDACDDDIDGDGTLNADDAFPNDNTETVDTDGDGVGDNADLDADGDGIDDATEDAATADPDGDGIPNYQDLDSDGDGYLDRVDLDPYNAAVTINFAPVASDATASTDEDTVLNGDLSVAINDANSDTYDVTLVANASNGAVVVNANGTYSYTPNANFNGSDSFTFRATENATGDAYNSNVATVAITINAVNDAPVGVDDDAGSTPEETTLNGLTLAANDTDVEGDALAVTAVDATSANGGAVVLNGDGTVSYTPAVNFNGTDTFGYTVSDGVDTGTATVTVTVTAVNDAPVAVADAIGTVEDTATAAFDPAANDTDIDGDGLSTTAVDATSANGGTVALNTGMVTYTPPANFNGTDTFGYTVSDGNGGTDTATVTVTVSAENDAPVAAADSANVLPDGSVEISVLANDSDIEGDTLTVTAVGAVSGVTGGSASITGGGTTVTFDATGALDTETATFTYTVSDGNGGTDTANVTVNVVANVPPVPGTVNLVLDEDTSATTADVIAAASDAEGDTITLVSVDTTSALGTIVDNGNNTFTYTANANANGSDSFGYVITDGTSNVNGTVNVTINPVNDDPTATDDTASATANGSPVVIDVLANDAADIDGDTVTITAVSAVTGTAGGSASNTATDVTYTPGTASGTATFTYTVSDGNGGSATATVTVTVTEGESAAGVWKLDTEVTGLSGTCDYTVGDQQSVYVTVSQAGNDVTMKTVYGDDLIGGTIDPETGVVTGLSGTTTRVLPDLSVPQDDTQTVTEEDAISVTATVSGTSMTGTVTIAESVDSALECTVDRDITTGTKVYQHTGTEIYDGVYALEALEFESESFFDGFTVDIRPWEERISVQVQFGFDDPVETVVIRGNAGPNTVFSNQSFDPATGFFSITQTTTEEEDWDENGTVDWSSTSTSVITGILLRDPAVSNGTNGAPLLALASRGSSRNYAGTVATGTPDFASVSELDAYGARQTPELFTRTVMATQGNGELSDRIYLGIKNPPLSDATTIPRLWLEVLDGGTTLCSVPYLSDATNSGQLRHFNRFPQPDFATEQFFTSLIDASYIAYGSINCNTQDPVTDADRVVDGGSYTARIVDVGANGAIGGGDDTVVFSVTDLATVSANRYSSAPVRSDISVNGSTVSETMLGGVIPPVFGFINPWQDIPVSFPTFAEGADAYQVDIHNDGEVSRLRFASTTPGVTIPAGTLDDDEGSMLVRLRALSQDGNGYKAVAQTSDIQITPGVYGLFNLELGSTVDIGYQTLQVMLEGEEGNLWQCQRIVNENMECAGGSFDFAANTVTLNMTDVTGGLVGVGMPFTLVLTFSDTMNASVDSPDVAAINPAVSLTSARAVNPETLIRSIRMSNGNQQNMVTFHNLFMPWVYDRAIFKVNDDSNLFVNGADTTFTARVMWDALGGVHDLSNVGATFITMPTDDGLAQFNGQFVTRFTGNGSDPRAWSLGWGLLADDYYKVVVQSNDGSPNVVFRNNYTAPADLALYTAPTLGQVTVNRPSATNVTCAAATNCDSGTVVDLGTDASGSWGLTWAEGSAPAGSAWQLRVVDTATGFEVRSPFMIPGASPGEPGYAPELVDNGTTLTWTNPGYLDIPSGMTVVIQLRVVDQPGYEHTKVGAAIPAHQVYVSAP